MFLDWIVSLAQGENCRLITITVSVDILCLTFEFLVVLCMVNKHYTLSQINISSRFRIYPRPRATQYQFNAPQSLDNSQFTEKDIKYVCLFKIRSYCL